MSELTRLKIWAFESDKFTKTIGDTPFEVQINPESFSISYAIEYEGRQGKGTSSFSPKWVKNSPRKLSFEILFDATGATPTKEDAIEKQINRLDATMFRPQSKKHKPNYLQIEWGALVYCCCLDSMNVTYKLFAPDGFPLRATASVSFSEVVREEPRVKKEGKQSPDITHAFTVKEGDTLPLMSENVYGDTAYYIAVAQANKLIQFRNLKAGNRLLFPPINKTDA